ncbi:MAG: PAS domain-containing protein [Thermoplasmata archaeon]
MASAVHLEWFDQLPCAVTVCGKDYTILYMNDRSAQVNADDGGKALIGKNLMDCHPPEAQTKLKEVMASGRPNVYTTQRGKVKKVIFQGHWNKRGRVAGLVEITFELPRDMPHFVRT